MNLQSTQILIDKRINCLSISACITIKEYLNWYNSIGKLNKLDEQRPVMNTRSANLIRKRLIDDISQGAIIPPIVLGVSVNEPLAEIKYDNFNKIFEKYNNSITVIDGMQRTEALNNAIEQTPDIVNNTLRIEIWVSNNTANLIYRMLVLNTGQTPWDVKRQLEVIYKPLIDETCREVHNITINTKNDKKRRTTGGEYQASAIVELFLAFTSRKEIINKAERLADDFTRLEVVKMVGEPNCSPMFYRTIELLTQLDIAVSRYKGTGIKYEDSHFFQGMDLFTEMPSKVGFVVAIAQYVIGRIGGERDVIEQQKRMEYVEKGITKLIGVIDTKEEDDDLGSFLSFDSLNEKIMGLDKKKIGNAQREYFKKVFSEMIQMFGEITDMSMIWMAD